MNTRTAARIHRRNDRITVLAGVSCAHHHAACVIRRKVALCINSSSTTLDSFKARERGFLSLGLKSRGGGNGKSSLPSGGGSLERFDIMADQRRKRRNSLFSAIDERSESARFV